MRKMFLFVAVCMCYPAFPCDDWQSMSREFYQKQHDKEFCKQFAVALVESFKVTMPVWHNLVMQDKEESRSANSWAGGDDDEPTEEEVLSGKIGRLKDELDKVAQSLPGHDAVLHDVAMSGYQTYEAICDKALQVLRSGQ
jgi:hypothetical protein